MEMSEGVEPPPLVESWGPDLQALEQAASRWAQEGASRPLRNWLHRAVGADGMPRRGPVGTWFLALEILDRAYRSRPQGWPAEWQGPIESLLIAAYRFARPDGGPILGPPDRGTASREVLRSWADRLATPRPLLLSGRWSPRRGGATRRLVSLPPAAWADERAVLAISRSVWEPRADVLAVDDRPGPAGCRLELIVEGRALLGPGWNSGQATAASRVILWRTSAAGDLYEWTSRVGAERRTRTVLVLPDRKLALIAEQVDRPKGPASLALDLAPSARVHGQAGENPLVLSSGTIRAQAIPLGGLVGQATSRLAVASDRLVLSPLSGRARLWLPLLISWGPQRLRRPLQGRVLTVTERARVCPPEVAFAARVGWGREESLVIYRSLAPPANRALLGHATSARFLVGRFTQEGKLVPMIEVE